MIIRRPGTLMTIHIGALIAVIALAGCGGGEPVGGDTTVDLTPTSWPAEVLEAYLEATGGTVLSDALGSRGLTLQTEGRDGIVASPPEPLPFTPESKLSNGVEPRPMRP